jgi:DNA/RNA-binding protein KIN17
MIESGDVLKLDQSQLETVIPAIGSKVKIVNGAYRGQEATLLSINTEQFKAQIRLDTGNRTASVIQIDYEDICKIA